MKIDLANFPEEGLRLEGELPAEVLAVPHPDTNPASPLRYDLFANLYDTELVLQGELSAKFTLTCVRTLHPFEKTVVIPDVTISLDTGGEEEVDLAEALREEILLQLPDHPVCDLADEPQHCEIDSKYLAVDKTPGNGVKTPPAGGPDSRWDVLDTLRAASESSSDKPKPS